VNDNRGAARVNCSEDDVHMQFVSNVGTAQTEYGPAVALQMVLHGDATATPYLFRPEDARVVAFFLLQMADEAEGKGSPSGAAN
jgi:hypothetical protein